MKIRIRGLRLPLSHHNRDIIKTAAIRLDIDKSDIESFTIIKKAVDARKQKIYYVYTVDVDLKSNVVLPAEILSSPEISMVEKKTIPTQEYGDRELAHTPIIVGSGPAGLFCALYLARHGYRPVIIEQGLDMDQRIEAVEGFWRGEQLQLNANAQFGEGGAGTFSDGKLTTRIGDERVELVLETFVEKGAPEEIRYLKKPHVGTDIIRQVVKKIRQEILDRGGEFYFNTQMTDIIINKGSIKSIIINKDYEVPAPVLVLAVGNSAREVYQMLNEKGVIINPKAFAVGVRIEHPQKLIDKIQYGSLAGDPQLPAADYQLTYQDRQTGRSLYTFCMCPGGYVIAAASEAGQVVTNGMSYFKRDSGVANSALVVTVSPQDWQNETLGGIKLQEQIERRAFILGGENYHAPAQFLTEFLEQKTSSSLTGSIATYSPGLSPANLEQLFPTEISGVMRRGIKAWGERMKGFVCEEAIMTGVETRTSAPVRIERDPSLCSVNIAGMYPCGEGSGYAGGIISSAVDGIKVAEKIIFEYSRPQAYTELQDNQIIRGSALPRI